MDYKLLRKAVLISVSKILLVASLFCLVFFSGWLVWTLSGSKVFSIIVGAVVFALIPMIALEYESLRIMNKWK